jgi:predicted GNAT superfamily acetyltransferase
MHCRRHVVANQSADADCRIATMTRATTDGTLGTMGTATANDLAEQAAAAAATAAARANVEIRAILDADAAHRVSRLLSEIWANDHDQPIVAAEIIRTLAHVTAYGAMAVTDTGVIGAALGFLGGDIRGTYLHSYIAGVTEKLRGGNVGFALKQDQRAWSLRHGLTRVTWTFDPLVRRNAYFNLVKLGATAVGFHRDFYGSMQDEVNAGDLSDRILIEWDLESRRAVDASALRPHVVDLDALGGPAVVRLTVGAGERPEVGAERGAIELVQVPADIVALRNADPDLARQWRLALRQTLGAALEEGYRADGITRDGWYVVRRDPRT